MMYSKMNLYPNCLQAVGGEGDPVYKRERPDVASHPTLHRGAAHRHWHWVREVLHTFTH